MDFWTAFKHDIKAFNNKNFLSTKDSYLILEGILAELSIHNSEDEILGELSKNHYKGKKRQIIKRMLSLIEKDQPSENVFLKYGLINKDEYLLFAKSNSFKDAVSNTIQHREEGSKFPLLASKISGNLIFFVTLSLLIMAIAGQIVVNFFMNQIKPILDEKVGYSVSLHFPIMFENVFFSSMVIIIWFSIIAFVLYLYSKTYKSNPKKIYAMFPLKFYDDFIKYFSIANRMKKVGIPPDDIFEFLSNNAEPKGLRKMFLKMTEGEGEIAPALILYKCPDILSSKVITAEETNAFWKTLESKLIAYAKETRDSKIRIYNKFIVLPSFLMGSFLVTGTIAWVVFTLIKMIWIASRF